MDSNSVTDLQMSILTACFKCRVSSKTIDITFLPLLPTTEVQSLDALGTHIRKYFKFSKVTSEY